MIRPLLPLLERLPYRHDKRDNQPALRGPKAMTIAVGFFTHYGVVLCSDSQLTAPGFMKYEGPKVFVIFPEEHSNDHWLVGLTYAGDPERMARIYERMERSLLRRNATIDKEYVRTLFEKSLAEVRRSIVNPNENIDVLCGFADSDGVALFLGKSGAVTQVYGFVPLGAGDSSVIRYLEKLLPVDRSLEHPAGALVLSAYVVRQASKYVELCGGGLQACILQNGFSSGLLGERTLAAVNGIVEKLDRFLGRALVFSSGVELFEGPDYAPGRAMEMELATEALIIRREIGALSKKI